MANWWDNDPIVQSAPRSPSADQWWASDPVVQEASGPDHNDDLWVPGEPVSSNITGENRADPMWWARQIASGAPGAINAIGEGFGEGIPVVGPLVTEAGLRAGAGLSSLITGEPFDEALTGLRDFREDRMEGHEGARLAGNVAGAVAPLGLLGSTATGGQMLGMSGTLPQRVGAGLASGGLIAGADTAARGGDLSEISAMTGIGAAAGAAFPLAERAISPIVSAVRGQVPISSEARLLSRALTDDSVPANQIGPRLQELGPDAMIADLGPNLQRQAGALASTPGPGQQTVRQSIADRAAGTSGRVLDDVARTIGTGPDASLLAEEIIARQAAASDPLYKAIRMEAIQPTPALRNIMGTPLGRRATNEAMQLAANDQIPPNAGFTVGMADYMKRALDDIAAEAFRTGKTNQARQARNMARVITHEVDRLVPAYRDARQAFAGPAQVLEALEEGQSMFRNTVSPADLRRTLEGMTDSQREAYISGARSAVQDMLGTARNDALQVRNTFLRGWNQEKLKILLGEDVARDLVRSINREMQYANTHHIVSGNSETAARQLAQGEVAGQPRTQAGTVRSALNLRFGDAIATAFDRAIGGLASVQRGQRNARLAANLTSGQIDPALEAQLQILQGRRRPSALPPAGAANLITNQGDGG